MRKSRKEETRIRAKQYAEFLNEKSYSIAERKLKKVIFLKLWKLLTDGKCPKCKLEIEAKDVGVGHIEPWRRCRSSEGDANLFWDINNIQIEHIQCNRPERCSHKTTHGVLEPNFHEEFSRLKCSSLKRQMMFDKDLLGMPSPHATLKLYKIIMFEWAKKTGLINCCKCKKEITDIKQFSIEHIKPWLSGETNEEKRDLFFNPDNLGFSHLHCNCGNMTGKGESGYNGVVRDYDSRGKPLWKAKIMSNGKNIFLCSTTDLIKAAEAYDMGLIKYRRAEGLINFPEKMDYYLEKIKNGWHEPKGQPKCKICGATPKKYGYCSKCYYWHAGGKEKRRAEYLAGKG